MNHRRGFTLLEVMLGVTILALVMTAVYSIWSASLTGWKRGEEMAASAQRSRVVLDRLEDLTQAAVFAADNPSLYAVTGSHDAAGSDTVSFVTGSDTLLPASEQTMAGLRRVTLALNTDANGRSFLAIANVPAFATGDGTEEITWHTVSADVVGFRVRYRNPRDGIWVDYWSETQLVPSAIEFTVAFRAARPDAEPWVVTQAMELPAAAYVLSRRGVSSAQQNTTHEVTVQDINLSAEEPDDEPATP